MHRRLASINDLPILESDRKYHWELGPRPEGHAGFGGVGAVKGRAQLDRPDQLQHSSSHLLVTGRHRCGCGGRRGSAFGLDVRLGYAGVYGRGFAGGVIRC